jgi:hypothetical protein
VLLRGSGVVVEDSRCLALHQSKSTEPLLPDIKVSPFSTKLGKFHRVHGYYISTAPESTEKSTENCHQPLPGRPSRGRSSSGQRSFRSNTTRRRPKAKLYFRSLHSQSRRKPVSRGLSGFVVQMDSTLRRDPSPTESQKTQGAENERGLRENPDELYFPTENNVGRWTMA